MENYTEYRILAVQHNHRNGPQGLIGRIHRREPPHNGWCRYAVLLKSRDGMRHATWHCRGHSTVTVFTGHKGFRHNSDIYSDKLDNNENKY